MAQQVTKSVVAPTGQTVDLGALMLEDSQSVDGMNVQQVLQQTQTNFCLLYKELFKIKKSTEEQNPDGEFMEYTKSKYLVELPAPQIVLPREKPIPKEKTLTRWEKFRKEKGLPTRAKRSRLVFDKITNDWVPRWGPYSIKKIEEKA